MHSHYTNHKCNDIYWQQKAFEEQQTLCDKKSSLFQTFNCQHNVKVKLVEYCCCCCKLQAYCTTVKHTTTTNGNHLYRVSPAGIVQGTHPVWLACRPSRAAAWSHALTRQTVDTTEQAATPRHHQQQQPAMMMMMSVGLQLSPWCDAPSSSRNYTSESLDENVKSTVDLSLYRGQVSFNIVNTNKPSKPCICFIVIKELFI